MNSISLGKRVAIVGTHCSGKTSICHGLVSKLISMNIKANISREAARLSYYLASRKIIFEMQFDLLVKHVSEEMDNIRSNEIVICDRTVLEVLVYTDLFFPEKKSEKEKKYYNIMYNFTKDYIKTYDMIFRTTNHYNPELATDEIRLKDKRSQLFVEDEIKKRLEEFEVIYRDLPSNNIIPFIIEKMREDCILSSNHFH
jgi:deoxyadenosine/deoxycytidine kinase